jgi:site-specific recombinase XerD
MGSCKGLPRGQRHAPLHGVALVAQFNTKKHTCLCARKVEAWALGRKSEFVFYNFETGKPLVDLKSGFGRACRKAGIDGVSWHTLRHTFASRLVNRGVDIVTVQELLGHSTVTITMRYTHTNLDSKHAAVAKLEEFGDNLVTVCTKMQQSKEVLSPNAVISYNVAAR